MQNTTQNTPDLIAWQVSEGTQKAHWTRIGVAWKNKKGGYQLKLNALPVYGELVLLPPKEDD